MSKHYMAEYETRSYTFKAFGATEELAIEYLEYAVVQHLMEAFPEVHASSHWHRVRQDWQVKDQANVFEFDTDKPVAFRDYSKFDVKIW